MRKIRNNLKSLLESKGWEQKKLSEVTGIREATISDMCRNINKMYSRQVLEKIADALEIDDINKIIEIENG
ncbi:XRE family transcriptional regulator [Paenibacillus psychroresistens]|uniref:XRE family transcriptional regulator n=1 Tax=Paenibacillus psychroresistens TaxID=1778678 RepID=A0A6B8RQJ3_9BACL|nr:helix-turn-helix transcriptional regulator [Paenibacillus psychroresistens]QGQ97558.1 XRE family transcriptional regulator [Paenibacillus psychroresistens]